jgi:hypothetical protein
MLITCADCGCLVDRGKVVTPCDRHPECCRDVRLAATRDE